MITPETEMLERAAQALGSFTDEVVFVGGAVVGLMLTDTAAAQPRPTDDVDIIIEALTLPEYYKAEQRMRDQGFAQDPMDKVTCRWHGHGLTIDLMPSSEVTGLSNRWYPSAVRHATEVRLPSESVIKVVDAPHLLSTKLEAWQDRGSADLYASHDFEDIVLLIDGRPELAEEMKTSPKPLQTYVSATLGELLSKAELEEAVEGHLAALGDSFSRAGIVIGRIKEFVRLNEKGATKQGDQ